MLSNVGLVASEELGFGLSQELGLLSLACAHSNILMAFLLCLVDASMAFFITNKTCLCRKLREAGV